MSDSSFSSNNQPGQYFFDGHSQNSVIKESDPIRSMEFTITLQKQETGFGLRIIGGTEEGCQVSVGQIVPNGSADLDGRLRTGDEITHVDGQNVINSSHHRMVGLMTQAGQRGHVTLGVRRRVLGDSGYLSVGHSEMYPYDVLVTRRETEGFGFVIISSISKMGSVIGESIGKIIENSPAERCGRLHVGDRILAVNGVDISHMHHEDIVNLIKDTGYSVTLTVGPPIDDTASNSSNSQKSPQGSMVSAMAYPAVPDSELRRTKNIIKMAEGGICLDAVMCDLCEKEPAQFFCRTCDGNLCNECKEDHKRKKMFLRHDVVKMTLTRKMEMKGFGYCTEHQESKYELSCQACAVPVCTKCIANKHNGHKMTDISSAYLDAKRRISKIIKEIDESLLPKNIRSLDELETVLSDVKRQSRDLEQTVVQRSQSLCSQVQSIEKELLHKICHESTKCNNEITAEKNDIEIHLSSLQELQRTLTEKRDSLSMTELILYMMENLDISERHREFPTISFQPASFLSNVFNDSSLRMLFGLVLPSRVSRQKIKKRIMAKSIVTKRIRTTIKSPIGLFVVVNHGNVWVRGEDVRVDKINPQGDVVATISTRTQIGRPSGLIEIENGMVWYTDLENKKIRILSNDLKEQDKIDTEWHPIGMCRSQSGHILVCVAFLSLTVTNESDVGKILRMDYEGNIFQEIQKNSKDENLFIRPICITENINQDICVSDCHKDSIVVVDKTGLFRFAYDGGFTKSDGRVFTPTELDHDSDGNIIVCDCYNKLVHLVDINGGIFKHILRESDGISSPRGLKVDSEDKLWITDEDTGCIMVVQYID
uniref:Uncharacterized protein LOC111107545 isoform X4 n=1 Tax=Crassostrea virginica TaxID=6565 RepID=A0A8B8B5X2_CRAVI|nr:uncharacterized protein LOC111107545 isoform X4 [Crassostrea virginica]